jgi:hypothetical protein
MAKGKMVKYYIYAIGEIFLVVKGILIALQINNWNEARKENKLTQNLYVLLRSSIMADTLSFNKSMKSLEKDFESAQFLQEATLPNIPYNEHIDKALANIYFIKSSLITKYFNRILAVGFEIITDETLKNEIQHYYED